MAANETLDCVTHTTLGSQSTNVVTSVSEPSADDQELFLKVLENLKNAVSSEAQQTTSAVRSETEEPGTTTVTVSDKTKSLILQKIASERSSGTGKSDIAKDTVFINVSRQNIVTSQVKATSDTITIPTSNVVLSYVSYDSLSNDVSQRNAVAVKSLSKENISVAKTPEKAGMPRAASNTGTVQQKTPSVQLYPCSFCDYYSDNKSYLKQHVDLVHTSERPFKCPYCDYAGKRSHALREHLIVHTDERPFQCKICNATFRKKGHLTNHVKLHNSKRLVKCPLCKVLVYDIGENGLDAHLKNDHDTERLFGCDLCDHVAANEPDILKHLSQKHKSKLVTHKCEKCAFETADAVDFQVHVNAHELAERKVEIGAKSPTKVIGVAAIATAKLQPGIPNTSVKFTVKPSGDTNVVPELTTSQSALIKPVWIKCSECGFVEQDSEAVKAHMLEHIKEQFGEDYMIQPMKPEKTKPAETFHQPTEPVVSHQERQEKSPTQTPKGPILVPVTNVEQLLPQHAGKIDMNSPILVPVTDPSLIKSLQSQTGIIATSLPSVSRETKVSSILVEKSSQSSTSLTEIGQQHSGRLKLSLPMSVPPQVSFQALPKNTNVKVVPLTTTAEKLLPPSTTTSTLQPTLVTSVVPASSALSLSPVPLLTKIPVPRNFSVGDQSKLPPEYAKLTTDKKTTYSARPILQEQKTEVANEQKLASLKENLASVQKLIQEQEKISKQLGNSVVKLDRHGIPEKVNVNGVVYYIEPTEKQNTSVTVNESFTHDSAAGRFKCTLCGYTCEYQRTIKAHIWKHSGNKNVDYPMFQNGPLSVYEDETFPVRPVKAETPSVAPAARNIQMVQSVPISEAATPTSSNLPAFIVYESPNVAVPGKISNVAPQLANLIVARTLAAMTSDKKKKLTEEHKLELESIEEVGDHNNDAVVEECTLTIDESEAGSDAPVSVAQSVVVEAVENVGNSDAFTAIQSQQNSPRVAAHSPDSGLSEMASSRLDDQTSVVTSVDIAISEHAVDDSALAIRSSKKRTARSNSTIETKASEDSILKKARIQETREDSAVTLLSLLKKGPNFNPACPTTSSQSAHVAQYSNASSPGKEDSNSIGDSDAGSGKPKSGISTSLLAVIEQLRERSKSDVDEEKQQPPPPKKQYRRRSRKSSIEDNTPASGIENVEEYVKAGEVKYRCKLCHYTNDSTLLLRQHMKLHKPKQQFECSLCDLIAESSEALQDHMIQHCKVRTYQCKLCSSAFSYKSQLRAHMRMHNDQDLLMCDLCDFETRNVTGFRLHMKSHASKPLVKCNSCNAEFETNQSLKDHKKSNCPQSTDKSERTASHGYACVECGFISVGRREMKHHQKIHMGKAMLSLPKKCPYCEHTETTIELIRKHISEVHGESKPLKCEMCGFFAVSIRSLKSHMKRHVNDQRFVAQPLEQYKCNLCGYVCHHLPSLKSHMWRHAADMHYSYEFTNDIINAAIDFDSLTDVTETTNEHVESFRRLIIEKMKVKGLEHTRDTLEESAKTCCWVTFRCCQCGFETINKAELNKHMSAHTDVIKKTLEVAGNDKDLALQEEI